MMTRLMTVASTGRLMEMSERNICYSAFAAADGMTVTGIPGWTLIWPAVITVSPGLSPWTTSTAPSGACP
jgi:hypothetical protein